jgi:hypothetical protein
MENAALIETAAAIAFANRGRRTLTFPFTCLVCAEMPWPPVLDKNEPNISAFDWNVAAIFFKMVRPFFNFPQLSPNRRCTTALVDFYLAVTSLVYRMTSTTGLGAKA